jgi:AcrR family transcriptional regulator
MRADSVRLEQAAATRQRLIDTARSLFASQGYQATSTEQIVATAAVTRGALYHHFDGKTALFGAVFNAVQRDVMARADPAVAGQPADPWEKFRLRMQSYLDAVLKTEVQQILLIDGPAVLGWPEWRRLEEEYGIAAIGRFLEAAMAAGVIAAQPITPLARLLLALINEAALTIVNSADPAAMRPEIGAALDTLLRGVR